MRTRTKAGLLTRLERLECRFAAIYHTVKLRFGHLKQLPREYQGERHVIVARDPTKHCGQGWVEFEDVPGPDLDPPQQSARGIPHRLDVMFVGPYPRTEKGAVQQLSDRAELLAAPLPISASWWIDYHEGSKQFPI